MENIEKPTPEECDEKLLQGVYQTASMFLNAIDALIPKVKDQKMKDTMELERRGVDKIMDDAVRIMRSKKIEPKAPNIFTRAAAWMGVQFNSLINADNRHIAEMMTEGCTMGIYGSIENIYDFQKADTEIKKLCEDLMHILEEYLNSMKYFLTH